MLGRPSALVLIAANLVPLGGVFLFDWSVFEIVFLYWTENVAIGAVNVLKMIAASPDMSKVEGKITGFAEKMAARAEDEEDRDAAKAVEFYGDKIEEHAETIGVVHQVTKFMIVPFFCVHYGMFCLVHGVFVVALLSDGGMFERGGMGPSGSPFELIGSQLSNGPLLLSSLALGGSHLFSFFVNFLGKGEYRRTGTPILMTQPYGRIMVLHIAIIFGAFLIMLLGSPVFLLLILIGGKSWLDLKMHLRERAKNAVVRTSSTK